ncbi:hypothetical protein NE237_030137 [Protea cynaroides]|uniref:Uncharacterized protein n=1 Tax=Protea cynaroides TaxID=273540 RepID=A0A9Q0GVL1_9MAGN|nr:hypothetical protein NE237_030137 [Protea cynaroides]
MVMKVMVLEEVVRSSAVYTSYAAIRSSGLLRLRNKSRMLDIVREPDPKTLRDIDSRISRVLRSGSPISSILDLFLDLNKPEERNADITTSSNTTTFVTI